MVRSSRQVKVQCSTLSEICLLYGEYMYFIVHYTDAFLLTYIHTYIHTYKDTYICVRKRNRYNYHVVVPIYFVLKPYIHTCMHAYIHTYIYTHTHIYSIYTSTYIYIWRAQYCMYSRPLLPFFEATLHSRTEASLNAGDLKHFVAVARVASLYLPCEM